MSVTRDVLLAQIDVVQSQLDVMRHLLLATAEPEEDTDAPEKCPACGSTDHADAGDGARVCGACAAEGRNTVFREGKVLSAER